MLFQSVIKQEGMDIGAGAGGGNPKKMAVGLALNAVGVPPPMSGMIASKAVDSQEKKEGSSEKQDPSIFKQVSDVLAKTIGGTSVAADVSAKTDSNTPQAQSLQQGAEPSKQPTEKESAGPDISSSMKMGMSP